MWAEFYGHIFDCECRLWRGSSFLILVC